jgi:hypothetical protein
MRQAMPPKCPCCDSRLPLEQVGSDRYLCACCSKDFRAVRDARGDWTYDVRPLRLIRRLSA